MSKMGDFIIGLGEQYQKDHPGASWEEAMRYVIDEGNGDEELDRLEVK